MNFFSRSIANETTRVLLLTGLIAAGIIVSNPDPKNKELSTQEVTISKVTTSQAYFLYKVKAAVFLDLRPSSDYDAGHIPGALHLDPMSLSKDMPSGINDASNIVIYGTGGNDPAISRQASMFQSIDREGVAILSSGWREWALLDLPREGTLTK